VVLGLSRGAGFMKLMIQATLPKGRYFKTHLFKLKMVPL